MVTLMAFSGSLGCLLMIDLCLVSIGSDGLAAGFALKIECENRFGACAGAPVGVGYGGMFGLLVAIAAKLVKAIDTVTQINRCRAILQACKRSTS